MAFLIDECIDVRPADVLRDQGHDATAVARDYTRSLTDANVLAIAEREGRVLIANDTDFGELVVRHRQQHAGVVLLRLGSYQFADIVVAVTRVLTDHAADLGQFMVVTRRMVRVCRTEQEGPR